MIVPYRHISQLSLLTPEEQSEIMKLLGTSTTILQKALSPDAFNIGMNLGKVAGAGIDDHLHFHIVPRWNGDTNFMPVTGHTKVISQGLYESWEQLQPLFQKIN